MSDWAPKRFWKDAQVEERDGSFAVLLDGRVVKTPAKTALLLPSRGLAAAVADEWQAQDTVILPASMPSTRAANSAIDKITPLFDAVVDEIAGFGASDLLCYRAETPAELADRQRVWDGPLLWAAARFDAPLTVTAGIVPVDQPPASLAALRAEVARRTVFELAALHDLVAISGSLILGLAVAEGHLSADAAFDLSRLDETWQAEHWGQDEEAAAADALRRHAFHHAARFNALCR